MPRKDRSFTHIDVIRLFEKNLSEHERFKVLLYMLIHLLGFERMKDVLWKAYAETKSLDMDDLARVLMDVIDFFVLGRRKWKAVRFIFDWLLKTYDGADDKLKIMIDKQISSFLDQTQPTV